MNNERRRLLAKLLMERATNCRLRRIIGGVSDEDDWRLKMTAKWCESIVDRLEILKERDS